MLTTLLPWAALILAALALWIKEDDSKESPDRGPWLVAGLAALVLALGAGWIWRDALKDLWPTSLGFAGGGLVALVAYFLNSGRSGVAAPTALGVFGAAVWTLVGVDAREPFQLGAAAGICLVGWLLAGSGATWPARASVAAALCLFGDILGKRGAGGHSDHAGSLLGLVLVVAVLLARGIPKRAETAARNQAIGLIVGAGILVLGGWLLASRHFFLGNLWILFAGGAAVGLVAAWLVPDSEDRSTGFVMGSILWLAAATLAFGERQGYGMAVAALGGLAMATALGRTRSLLTMAPLAMLVVYRLFRELHTDASRALDIGQHYALIGIVLGVALLVLAAEWRASRSAGSTSTVWASLLWLPMFLAVPFVSAVVLAAKGFIGVLAGLGFGPFIQALKGAARLDGFSLQLGVGAAMAGGYGWLSDKTDLAREEKIKSMLWVAALLVALAIAVALLSKERAEESPRTQA